MFALCMEYYCIAGCIVLAYVFNFTSVDNQFSCLIYPGYWFMHCHIELHSIIGMAVVFNEAPTKQLPVPPSFPACRDFPSEFGKTFLSIVNLYYLYFFSALIVCSQ